MDMETRGLMRDYQSFMVCITPTTACPVVSIELETTKAFTPEATWCVHTTMFTAVATLAFISICITLYMLQLQHTTTLRLTHVAH